MANGNNTANIGFEEQIWAAADILRGNMDAAEYKHVVLGLIFLKYLSDKFDERYEELKAEEDDLEDKDAYIEKNVFYVPPVARWSVIAEWAHKTGTIKDEKGKEEFFDIGGIIDRAMRAIEKENKRLKDILPKNYARSELDKRRLGNVVNLFSNIQMVEHGTDKDILGRAYEYCLAKFAEQEGKRAGEFYTPSCVVRTLVEVLRPFEGRVYDPWNVLENSHNLQKKHGRILNYRKMNCDRISLNRSQNISLTLINIITQLLKHFLKFWMEESRV